MGSLLKNDLLVACSHKTDVGLRLARAGPTPGAHEAGRSFACRVARSVAGCVAPAVIASAARSTGASIALSVVGNTAGSAGAGSLLGLDESEIMNLRNFFALSLGAASFPNFSKKMKTFRGRFVFRPFASGATLAMCMRCGLTLRPRNSDRPTDCSKPKAW